VSASQGTELAERLHAIYLETTALKKIGVHQPFETLYKSIIQSIPSYVLLLLLLFVLM